MNILPFDALLAHLVRQEPSEAERYLRQQLAEMYERHRLEADPIIKALVRIEQCRVPAYLVPISAINVGGPDA